MSALTVRLPNDVISEMDLRSKQLHISRSEYIRKSIENMNKSLEKEALKSQLFNASFRVRKESMVVNQEFSKIEDND